MAVLRPLKTLFGRIVRCGTVGQEGFRSRETILVNQLCLVGVVATAGYGLFFVGYDPAHTWPLGLTSAAFVGGFISALLLNARGRTIAARNMAMATAHGALVTTTYAVGREAGVHLYFFALAGLASMIHTRIRANVTLALAATSAMLFLICQFLMDSTMAPIPIGVGAQTVLFTVSALGTVFLCAYFSYVYRLSMYHAECELAAANRELAELSGSDALTRLANRRRMEERLQAEWRRLARTGEPMSVLMIDADHFKEFNDRYGHQAGDECLRRLARLARQSMRRATDVVARYGGEEFIAILPETSGTDAMVVAEKLRDAVERTDMGDDHPAAPGRLRLTVSIGVSTTVPGAGTSPESLIHCADQALYEAKLRGRNQVVFRTPAQADPKRPQSANFD